MSVAAPTSPTLRRVLAGRLCSGCGLCAGVSGGAVSMETVAPGWSRPVQGAALSQEAEAEVALACPGAKVAAWSHDAHPYWGLARHCETGHATDDAVRHQGSSGGVLTALALHALQAGLVDRVLHVLPDADHPTHNRIVLSDCPDDVLSGAGSRYAASSPLAAIADLLADEARTLFIGKPCDVSALRQLGQADPRVDARFPIKLSFFCAGVPSHAGADRVVRAMGMDPVDVRAFRYRGRGWPGLTEARDTDGRTATMRYADSWGGHLSKEVQFRCKICPDAVGGVADIACADAWYGGETGYPTFEEAEGRSLVLTRTTAGESLRRSALTARVVVLEPLPMAQIDLMQPSQARRKRLVSARVLGTRALGQPVPRMAGLKLREAARKATMGERLRDMVGTARRIATGRR